MLFVYAGAPVLMAGGDRCAVTARFKDSVNSGEWISAPPGNTSPYDTQHTTLTNPVGVMLGCCTAQRAVQWSLLTYDTIQPLVFTHHSSQPDRYMFRSCEPEFLSTGLCRSAVDSSVPCEPRVVTTAWHAGTNQEPGLWPVAGTFGCPI